MSTVTFDVIPADRGWVIRLSGDSQWELSPTKSEAIERARQLGRRYDAWRVRVLTRGGAVEQELASSDPARLP